MAFFKKLFNAIKKKFSRNTKSKGKKKKLLKKTKKAPKKPAPKPKAAPKKAAEPKGVFVGEVTHYFSRIKVCVVKVSREGFHLGDKLNMKGPHTNFTQKVESIQIENESVSKAKKGQIVGLKINKEARPKTKVFKLIDSKKGQNILEYTLLVATVVVILIAFLNLKGFFRSSLDQAISNTVNSINIMVNSLNFESK